MGHHATATKAKMGTKSAKIAAAKEEGTADARALADDVPLAVLLSCLPGRSVQGSTLR